MASKKEWMLGLPGHEDLVSFEDVRRLISGGQLRETDLVKRIGQPWKSAGEFPELRELFLRPSLPPKEPPRPTGPVPRMESPPARSETAKVARADATGVAQKGPSRPVPQSERRRPDPGLPSSPPRESPSDRKNPPTSPIQKVDKVISPPARGAPVPVEPRESAARPSAPSAVPATLPKGGEPSPGPATGAPSAGPKEEKKNTSAVETPEPPVETSRPDSTRIEKPPGEPPPVRRPRLPEVPLLEPMAPKYFSPVDLLRSASHSFEPRKLLVAAAALVPLMVLWSLLDRLRQEISSSGLQLGIFLVSTAVLVFGLAMVWTALAFATRRQLEGIPYRVAEVVVYGVRNLTTAVLYPLLILVPSLLALAALWVMGILRDMSPGLAVTLKILFMIPLMFALVAVAGGIGYQLASMYVPSAAAVEGVGCGGAVRAAWTRIRHQMGRMVLHWLIVTVAVGVITIVCLGLMEVALRLPDWMFGVPRDPVSLRAYERWREFEGLFAVYRGLAYGVGLTLPVSLLSTLGVLSYLTLRHPASAPLPGPLEETGSIPGTGRPAGSAPPGETWPAAARSGGSEGAPPGETRPAPGGIPEEVSDDSDEQPLA